MLSPSLVWGFDKAGHHRFHQSCPPRPAAAGESRGRLRAGEFLQEDEGVETSLGCDQHHQRRRQRHRWSGRGGRAGHLARSVVDGQPEIPADGGVAAAGTARREGADSAAGVMQTNVEIDRALMARCAFDVILSGDDDAHATAHDGRAAYVENLGTVKIAVEGRIRKLGLSGRRTRHPGPSQGRGLPRSDGVAPCLGRGIVFGHVRAVHHHPSE